MIKIADATGASVNTRPLSGRCATHLLACTIATPIAVNTPARPTLNVTINSNPKPMRFKLMAPNINTNAEGHGSNPPETPSASSPRHVIAAGGRWECV